VVEVDFLVARNDTSDDFQTILQCNRAVLLVDEQPLVENGEGQVQKQRALLQGLDERGPVEHLELDQQLPLELGEGLQHLLFEGRVLVA